jgi:hypothetical protein
MNRLVKLAAFALLTVIASCGGSKGGHLIVDHPIYEYQPPPEVGTADDDDGSDTGDTNGTAADDDDDDDDGDM